VNDMNIAFYDDGPNCITPNETTHLKVADPHFFEKLNKMLIDHA